MRPIGGYFRLETGTPKTVENSTVHLHLSPSPDAIAVNFGRGGLELIIRSRNYRKVWIPNYICPVVPECLDKLGVVHETYAINVALEPVAIPTLAPTDAFLYVNYFGIKDAYCRQLENTLYKMCSNSAVNLNLQPQPSSHLILDLTQAYYYTPTSADGFNSARKFFGVPDGGYVFGQGLSDASLPNSISYDRCSALLHRADGDVSGGYTIFQKLDESLREISAAKMSLLTRTLLAAIDQSAAATRRLANFATLHAALKETNELSSILPLQLPTPTTLDLNLQPQPIPLIYPYLVENGDALRQKLITAQIFCPNYWPGSPFPSPSSSTFASHSIVCIPIDQRYDEDDMSRIVQTIISSPAQAKPLSL